jgi:hypothetical protein
VRLERVTERVILNVYKFQFHKGTIRTEKDNADFQSRLNFNSIKVQLRLKIAVLIAPLWN